MTVDGVSSWVHNSASITLAMHAHSPFWQTQYQAAPPRTLLAAWAAGSASHPAECEMSPGAEVGAQGHITALTSAWWIKPMNAI